MHALSNKRKIPPEEYLERERESIAKSEYLAGEVHALAGASERHNVIAMNAGYLFVGQLKGRPCKTYGSDMRVKVEFSGLYTYPDVIVVCGKPQFEDRHLDTLLNPVVLIEILSDSTAAYDRGAKAEHYRTIPSLSDYLLIDQNRVHVEHYRRQPANQWLLTEHHSLDASVVLDSVACTLPLAELYDKVDWPAEPDRRSMLRLVKEPPPEWHLDVIGEIE
jgi:Uma2 family endonuclease